MAGMSMWGVIRSERGCPQPQQFALRVGLNYFT